MGMSEASAAQYCATKYETLPAPPKALTADDRAKLISRGLLGYKPQVFAPPPGRKFGDNETRRKLAAERKAKAVHMRKNGATHHEIATALGVEASTVNRYLRGTGL